MPPALAFEAVRVAAVGLEVAFATVVDFADSLPAIAFACVLAGTLAAPFTFPRCSFDATFEDLASFDFLDETVRLAMTGWISAIDVNVRDDDGTAALAVRLAPLSWRSKKSATVRMLSVCAGPVRL